MTAEAPITVAFRLDAAEPAHAEAVIAAIQAAGIVILPQHGHRTKRRGVGILKDGMIVINGSAADAARAHATEVDRPLPQDRDRRNARG